MIMMILSFSVRGINKLVLFISVNKKSYFLNRLIELAKEASIACN